MTNSIIKSWINKRS